MVKELQKLAWDNRILTAKMFRDSGQGGHFGGCFSSAEILTTLYSGGIMKVDPKNPKMKGRDHFILSKGHISAMFGSVLVTAGFFPAEKLATYDEFDSMIGMHTTLKIPGCDHPAGSLGHGLSVGVGAALAKKLDKDASRVFVLQGDGELNEGEPWSAAMSAAKFKLDNLISIIDRNMLSMDGPTEEIMPLEPLEDKWRSFGWAVETVDGHSVEKLLDAFKRVPFTKGKPTCIIAKTAKGKGIPYMEGKYKYHYGALTEEGYKELFDILNQAKESIK